LQKLRNQFRISAEVFHLEPFMVRLNHLMGPNQLILQGAARSAIWLIGQVRERSRWADLAHPQGRFYALAELCYVPLVVNQTTARNVPCRQTRKIGQMI